MWLAVVLVLISGAHVLFYQFSVSPLNTIPVSFGLTLGLLLWTTVLMVAMWVRRAWSRYAMIAFLVLGMAAYGLIYLKVRGESPEPLPGLLRLAVGGMVLYGLALVPLGFVRSIHRYLMPRTAGGR